MKSRSFLLALVSLALSISGCSYKHAAPALNGVRGYASFTGGEGTLGRLVPMQAEAAAPVRYIAQSDKLQVLTPADGLRKSWESAIAFCGTLKCEVVSSSISSATSVTEPSGEISVRVAPEDAPKLFSQIEKLGQVAEHTTDREDLTASVIDTDAKIKNLTAFRDSLRGMLAKPSVKVSDLVEIQKQLTETQADLDSQTAQRKVLANETEKVAVQISFRPNDPAHHASAWHSLYNAFSEAGSTLADSAAAVITTIFAIIPWLILIVPTVWLVVRLWKRFRRRNRNLPAAS